MPVKVMQASGVANYSDIAAGVLYAAQKGARVINLSLGGYSNSSALLAAIQTATETYSVVVVAGAGNDNLDTPFYPAAYEDVLAVAGTEQSDQKAGLSNYGDWIDLAAPAVAITTTFQGGDYGTVDGTSYAAPFVSGVAALLRSQNPTWSANTTQAQMLHTADDIDSLNPGFEGLLGTGRVNANTALSTPAQPSLIYEGHTVDGVEDGRPEPGETVDLDITIFNDWADAMDVQATLTSSDPYVTILAGAASFGDIVTYASGMNATPFQFSVSSSAPYNHDMNFTIQITADDGYATHENLTVTTRSGVQNVSGLISNDTIWTSDKEYHVTGNILVQDGVTLTIEAGTTILVDPMNYQFRIEGSLFANGIEQEPIIFSSNASSPQKADWAGILALNGGNVSLQYSIVEYADDAIAIGDENSAAQIFSCQIQHNQLGISAYPTGILNLRDSYVGENEHGIEGGGANSIISGNEIANNNAHGLIIISSGNPGEISGNLFHHNQNYAIYFVDRADIISNTIVYNQGGIAFDVAYPGGSVLSHNNFVNNHLDDQYYEIYNSSANLDAENNWWGTTDSTIIDQYIFDWIDEFSLGTVDYNPILTSPESTAPAYVVDVTISPDTTLGIQTATFDVEFSRAMDQRFDPQLSFQSTKHETWTVYDTSNSEIPSNIVESIALDLDGSYWFGSRSYFGDHGGITNFDGINWETYSTTNSPLPSNDIIIIKIDKYGNKWIGTDQSGLAKFDGQIWEIFNKSNSGLPSDYIKAIAVDGTGTVWIGTLDGGIGKFDGQSWESFNTSNSNIPENCITDIDIDIDNSIWVSTCNSGLAQYKSSIWTTYNEANSDLPNNYVRVIAIDHQGVKWFGTNDGVAKFDGAQWTLFLSGIYVSSIAFESNGAIWFGTNNGAIRFGDQKWQFYQTLPNNDIRDIAIDDNNSVWFATYIGASPDGGVGVLWRKPEYYFNDNNQWLNDHTYQSSYDITSLIPRDDYVISVKGAVGTDGIEITPVKGYTFTVDYAGAIGDTTPPSAPYVTACAGVTMETLTAEWSANDPDSSIDLFSYAIGTTSGGSDVVNWTNTTAISIVRSGLNLAASQPYYISVKARNEGGLWSAISTPDAVYAGSGVCTTTTIFVYLPMVIR